MPPIPVVDVEAILFQLKAAERLAAVTR